LFYLKLNNNKNYYKHNENNKVHNMGKIQTNTLKIHRHISKVKVDYGAINYKTAKPAYLKIIET